MAVVVYITICHFNGYRNLPAFSVPYAIFIVISLNPTFVFSIHLYPIQNYRNFSHVLSTFILHSRHNFTVSQLLEPIWFSISTPLFPNTGPKKKKLQLQVATRLENPLLS
jgi:hypothetical protein